MNIKTLKVVVDSNKYKRWCDDMPEDILRKAAYKPYKIKLSKSHINKKITLSKIYSLNDHYNVLHKYTKRFGKNIPKLHNFEKINRWTIKARSIIEEEE